MKFIKIYWILVIYFIIYHHCHSSYLKKNIHRYKSNPVISFMNGIFEVINNGSYNIDKCIPKSWEIGDTTVLRIFESIFTSWIPIAKKVLDFLSGFISVICKAKKFFMKILTSIINGMMKLKNKISEVKDKVTNVVQNAKGIGENIIENAQNITQSAQNLVTQNVGEIITNQVVQSNQNLVNGVVNEYNNIKESTNQAVGVIEGAQNNIKDIQGAVTKQFNNGLNVGTDIFKNPITEGSNQFLNTATNSTNIFFFQINSENNEQNIKSMVKKFWALSDSEVEGIFEIFSKKIHEALGKVKEFIWKLIEKMIDSFESQLITDLKNLFTCIVKDSFVSESVKIISNQFQNKLNLIKESQTLGPYGLIITIGDLLTGIICHESFKKSIELMEFVSQDTDKKYSVYGKSLGEFITSIAKSELVLGSIEELKKNIKEINLRKKKLK